MAEKNFTPEFGPNGAVLNAPGVTPERRQELEAQGSLKTMGREFVLPILMLAAVILTGLWVLQQGWLSKRELWIAGLGFFAACSAGSWMRRLEGWRRLRSNVGAAPPPPLIWRLAVDAIDFGGLLLIGGLWFWAIWLLAVADGADSTDTAILLVIVGNLAIFARGFLARRFLKLAARRGWATP